MSSRQHAGLSLACMVALTLSACAHGPSEASGSSGKVLAAPRRAQAPRFIHRRTFTEGAQQAAPVECDALCEQYKKALQAAMYPQPSAISTSLKALVPSTPGLVWQDGKILMGTWTTLDQFQKYKKGDRFPVDGDTWWTAVPDMQQWCQTTGLKGDALRVRIAQRLGMPPNAMNDGFVEVWVEPKDIFRPCPDPETQDHECMVEVPMIPSFQHTLGQAPWACSGIQVDASFVQVQDSYLQWMCKNWNLSYLNPTPYENYPWTALGYTYDWAGDSPVGPSEFVSPDQTEVTFERMATSDVYCSP